MSVYDQIAEGITPIGRDLPQVAGMLDARSRFQKLQQFQQEQIDYERGRDEKQDARLEKADLDKYNDDQLKHALAKVEWALQSESPKAALLSDPEAVRNFGAQGRDLNSLTDDQVVNMLKFSRGSIAAKLRIRPPAAQSPGTLYEVEGEGGPQFATADQAIGKRPFVKSSNEARGTWGQPFEAIDPMTGEPGMFQNHSVTGEIRPATVGAKPIGPKAQRAGSDSTAADSLIWRQAVAYFGGIIDPQTGNITGLDPTQTARIQELAAEASRLYHDGGGSIAPAEAVQQVISGGQQERPTSAQGTNGAASGTLPVSARARLKEGIVTTFANGQRWTMKNGQPTQVQ